MGSPPARDGDVPILQELEAARKAGIIEAYDLFLNRHPDHPLSPVARRECDNLSKSALLRPCSDWPVRRNPAQVRTFTSEEP